MGKGVFDVNFFLVNIFYNHPNRLKSLLKDLFHLPFPSIEPCLFSAPVRVSRHKRSGGTSKNAGTSKGRATERRE